MFILTYFQIGAQTPFFEEAFSSGSLPQGWKTSDISGNSGEWVWCDTYEGSSENGCAESWEIYSQQHGDFESSSASNGFMLMDSDGLGNLSSNHIVQMTSAPLNCRENTEIWIN